MPKSGFRILVVDDDPLQAKLATVALTAHGFAPPTMVATAAEALAHAAAHDIVLLDVQLPDGNGLEVLRKLRERSARPAVVIVTGHGAEQVAADALRHGADDYVSKDTGFIDLLPTVVERVRRALALRDELENAEREVVDSERRSAVGEMTVALHHEINNPLMAALTETALLREEPGLSPTLHAGLAVIRAALERIKEVVKKAGETDAARSTDYLAGSIRMADLDGAGIMRGLRGRALVAAKDAPVRRVISVLLRRAGFEVETFGTLEDVEGVLIDHPPPAVVIFVGYGRDDKGAARVALDPRRSWGLVIVAVPGSVDKADCGCDLLLPLPFDPATLAEQVVGVVER
ncbi:MAG: response regulator [Gemmatimonadetes bacterium]|nr:response regulator [Gemmatimonadota bacterium]